MDESSFDTKKVSHFEEIARKAVVAYDQLFLMALAVLSDNENSEKNVLVVGCGTGKELLTFAEKKKNWKLTGVDPSEEMINVSREKIQENKLNGRVSLLHGVVNQLPEEKEFDASTVIFVLRFIPEDSEKLSLLKDISDRLKPGARIVIVDQFGEREDDSFRGLVEDWKKYMLYNGIPSEVQNKIAEHAMARSVVSEESIKKLLGKAGFNRIKTFYQAFTNIGYVAYKQN
ncbi:MAG: hypothetical protein CVV24_00210 [Ignavibacteriae bacterium HGW-Ignavibacteriae-3]|nr:MAG: hypothetical protein CVV24_00210 [Ignavibacteriae bacterium HGW-Ignavibacteriae-3]